MKKSAEELYAQEYFDYLQKRILFRKLIRRFYLKNIKSYCIGATIDFGCGVGELLAMLPKGSAGFEVNKVAVGYCISKGLDVQLYIPEDDNYTFNSIGKGRYSTFTMNHVLEHLENANLVIEKIFASCYRLGIRRIVFTVPGQKGFRLDKTHRTFINKQYFLENGLLENEFYQLKLSRYFPLNVAAFGKYFRHNELRLVLDKRER